MHWIQIKRTLTRDFPPAGKYLIGVSGGRDSVTLLHWLVTNGYRQLIVCHLNHRLRGRSAEADARFVEKLAAKYRVDFACDSVDVRALAATRRISTETAAREARYDFFARIARRKRRDTIFLGHHADDLVETFLMNLFRGAGVTGLSGMRSVSTREVRGQKLRIVRPLLAVWREEIDQYVLDQGLKFREDASNESLAPIRNRIRRRVIPYLEKAMGRNIRQSVWRAASISAEEETWLDEQFTGNEGAALPVEGLRKMPIALQRRRILRWLREQNVSDIGFDVVERIRLLLDHESGASKVNLSRDRHVRRRAKKIFIAD